MIQRDEAAPEPSELRDSGQRSQGRARPARNDDERELERLLSELRSHFVELTGELRNRARLELAHARARGQAGVERLAIASLTALVGTVLAVLGAVYTLRGLVGGVAAATTPWAGQLVGGIASLVGIAVALSFWRRRRRTKLIEKVRSNLPDAPPESAAAPTQGG